MASYWPGLGWKAIHADVFVALHLAFGDLAAAVADGGDQRVGHRRPGFGSWPTTVRMLASSSGRQARKPSRSRIGVQQTACRAGQAGDQAFFLAEGVAFLGREGAAERAVAREETAGIRRAPETFLSVTGRSWVAVLSPKIPRIDLESHQVQRCLVRETPGL